MKVRSTSLYDIVGPNNRPMDVANRALMKPYHDWVDPNTESDAEIAQLLQCVQSMHQPAEH